jgi:hypothetical protein
MPGTDHTHYSHSQEPTHLWAKTNQAAQFLLDHPPSKPENLVLVYRGLSGVAGATAVSLAYHQLTGKALAMLYVRKRGEKSHSETVIEVVCSVLRPGNTTKRFHPVFVDDLIATGQTRRECLWAFLDYFRAKVPVSQEIQVTSLLLGGADYNTDFITECVQLYEDPW